MVSFAFVASRVCLVVFDIVVCTSVDRRMPKAAPVAYYKLEDGERRKEERRYPARRVVCLLVSLGVRCVQFLHHLFFLLYAVCDEDYTLLKL